MTIRKSAGPRLTILILLCAGIVTLLGYLFRTDSSDEPGLGLLTYKYRWGVATYVELDLDKDGTIEGRYRLPSRGDDQGWHLRYREGWESSECDGTLDLHWWIDPAGNLQFEQDTDGDGAYDLTGRGGDALERSRGRHCPPSG